MDAGGGGGVAENLNIRSEHKNCRQILQFSDKFLLSYDYRGCTLLLLRGYLKPAKVSEGGGGRIKQGGSQNFLQSQMCGIKYAPQHRMYANFICIVSNNI
jgi:hypothetical protein